MIIGLVQAALVAGLGAWMALAVRDNWIFPDLNKEAVALVAGMVPMQQEFPEDFAQLKHRQVTDPGRITLMFKMIRLSETVAAILLLSAAIWLAGGALMGADLEAARLYALVGTTGFVSIWAGFIIGGNYFAYWYCHQWAQSNHFMFMYWGFFVLGALLITL